MSLFDERLAEAMTRFRKEVPAQMTANVATLDTVLANISTFRDVTPYRTVGLRYKIAPANGSDLQRTYRAVFHVDCVEAESCEEGDPKRIAHFEIRRLDRAFEKFEELVTEWIRPKDAK